jgi:hypothetical protein
MATPIAHVTPRPADGQMERAGVNAGLGCGAEARPPPRSSPASCLPRPQDRERSAAKSKHKGRARVKARQSTHADAHDTSLAHRPQMYNLSGSTSSRRMRSSSALGAGFS